ncbi:hypothetical protein N0V83_003043 [Neocucurbitaria cava]|uniref:RING-type E3 ubiquitin transferase n=1 Tax=Neocucurbitaria cava TaxID=798079 RepID=A0A9W8YCY5_9PLEO|nr:hypothetical protein N0V83_003043 [Neocucurbitaria cava]
MRPLRLLLSLSTSLVAVTLLLYAALAAPQDEEFRSERTHHSTNQGSLKAAFSFTSPGSLFPPSAIISLTDDNSTFFLARPAAFGPGLPKDSLSGPLWIGSGFADDTLGMGELGCGDVPGWEHEGSDGLRGAKQPASDAEDMATAEGMASKKGASWDDRPETLAETTPDDGTDDHLQPSTPKTHTRRHPERADIQSLQESAEMAGKVALLKRGGCGFLAKVQWAQRRGATAVIVGDNVRGGALIRMYAKGDTSNITIPSVFTSHTTAHLLSSLLPHERILQGSTSADKAKTGFAKSEHPTNWPTSTNGAFRSTDTASHEKQDSGVSVKQPARDKAEQPGWLHSFLSLIGLGDTKKELPGSGSRRLPSSGYQVEVEDWHDNQKSVRTKSAVPSPKSTPAPDAFVIGEQDWRDPDLLPIPSSTIELMKSASPTPVAIKTAAKVLPKGGEYTSTAITEPKRNTWWRRWSHSSTKTSTKAGTERVKTRSITSISGPDLKKVHTSSIESTSHEGLWVTLTPTNVSSSPFFDTLLVLVVSPLVTLTVVYALLLLRSRIRRRRWRAPKSVVERLPVRTYQTISESSSSATPHASSPTTPLLQHSPSSSTSSAPRPRSITETEAPATSSSVQPATREREEEKSESGLAAWRRRYGGRQKECVVCLEEYVDGVSQVMSLPCGHEFHADCM